MPQSVSIIIPTYNRAIYLKKCIDSCLEQTYKSEIIVCDHGSTDETPEVVAKYKNKVKYIRREKDNGIHFCWLDGIINASSEFIHINFDDDWIENTFIEECMNLFNDDVGCVISNARCFMQDSQTYGEPLFNINFKTGKYKSKQLLYYNIRKLTSPCAGIFRKKILIDSLFIGKIPFTKRTYHGVGPDILFLLNSCIGYRYYGYVASPNAVFRAHSGSITIDANRNIENQKKIREAYDDARIYFMLTLGFKKLKMYGFSKFIFKIYRTLIINIFEYGN